MLRIAIVEDDQAYAKTLQEYVARFSEEEKEEFRVSVFLNGLNFIEDYPGCDIVFMDIEMPQMNGIEAAKKLRAFDTQCSLIFVTNMARYAVAGYEVDAMDFLVKPVGYFNFSMKLKKAVQIQKEKKNTYVLLHTGDGEVKVPVSNILYMDSALHMVRFHLKDKILSVRTSLKELEPVYIRYSFVRCSNSAMVNLGAVDRVVLDMVYVGKDELTISRSRKKAFLDALALYYGGKR